MTFRRRGRVFFWLARELTRKYLYAVVTGVILGLIVGNIAWRNRVRIVHFFAAPTERIGMVGEYTPSTLPSEVLGHISFGLTHIGLEGNAEPALAHAWEATDSGKRYRFHLDDTLIWHDGEPVTAQSVNYNIQDVRLEAIDDYTLDVVLEESYSPLPTLLSRPILQSGLKGFGSYKVEAIRLNGDRVVYIRLVPVTRNTGPIREYRFYPTEARAITAYKLGDVDMLVDMSSPHDLEQWGNTTITSTVRYDRIVSLFFNTRQSLFTDKAIRQGLGYAMPSLSEVPAGSPISVTSWAHNDNIKSYAPDAGTASELLEPVLEATASAAITISTFPQYYTTAQEIAHAWQGLGITASIKVEQVLPSDYHVMLSAQAIPPDPDQYPFWHSTQNLGNITGYGNVKIDKLLEDGRRETDRTTRKQIYADFQRFIVDDAPALFLYYPKTYTIERS